MSSILAACSGGTPPAATTAPTAGAAPTAAAVPTTAAAPTAASQAAPTTAAASTAQASSGGQSAGGTKTIKIARGQDADTLDPQKTSLLVAHEIMWQIYDSLVYLDEKGTVYPGLATSWKFSDDNKTLTFKLRENVKFHDGTPFDANAVKFTVERQQDPKTASPTAWMLGPLDSVEVIDPMTVAYKYKEPFVPLWVGLSYSYCAPISPEAVKKQGDQFGRNPVGTGPFRFVKWVPDQGITLEKNPDHNWATPMYKNKGLAYLDQATFVVIPEDTTRLAALASGNIDVIAGTDAVPTDKIKQLEKTDGVKVFKRSSVGTYWAAINTQIKPMDDVKVRQAMNYALDKEKLIGLVLDGNGKPATSPVASAFGDYDSSVLKYDYNLDKAKSLMKDAGQDKGFETTFLVIDSPVYKRAAEVIQEDLSKINVKIKIQAYPVAELITNAAHKQQGLTFFYYTYSDPDIVYQILHSGEVFDYSFKTDKELDDAIEKQRVEFDKAKRKDLLSTIQKRTVEQAYWLQLWEGVYAAAMRDYVTGIDLDALGFIHLQDIDRK